MKLVDLPESRPLPDFDAKKTEVMTRISGGTRFSRRRPLTLIVVVLGASALIAPALALRGVVLGHSGARLQPASVSQAHDSESALRSAWKTSIQLGAEEQPELRFANPTQSEFMSQLSKAADEYQFDVVSAKILTPVQDAPFVVIQTTDPSGLAKAAPRILAQLDPREPASDDRSGWAYEAFFFEARDAAGTPFLIVHRSLRDPHGGGGQWATNEALLPFDHG